jgi:hypothetical protein
MTTSLKFNWDWGHIPLFLKKKDKVTLNSAIIGGTQEVE